MAALREILAEKPETFSFQGDALRALAALAGPKALETLLQVLDETKPSTRQELGLVEAAIDGLALLGPRAREALGRLEEWAAFEGPSILQPYVVRGDARIAIRRVRGLKLGED